MAAKDSSNDLVPLDKPSDEDDTADKPIMRLFKNLISNRTKKNTMLSNGQIKDILEKEFDVNPSELHELELDIYLSVLKRFLKHWPYWDEFDKVVIELKKKGDSDLINKLLETKYANLKDYLQAMLDAAKPLAKEAVNKLRREEKKTSKDVIMEVHCSRSQLNNLFYQKPVPELNNTILNISGATPSKITVGVVPLQAILNWWFVEVHFDFKNVIFTRKTNHTTNHLLVNTKLGNPKLDKKPMDLNFQMNLKGVSSNQIRKAEIVEIINKINNLTADVSMKKIINIVTDMFLKEMLLAPEKLAVPAVYKRKWNKYPYVRYLFTKVESKVDDKDDKYDLRLQETIVPECILNIRKVDTESTLQQIIPGRTNYIEVECKLCMVRFSGNNMDVDLFNHFSSLHMNEPNFKCVNCDGEFTMVDLCENWWHHTC